MSRRNEEKKPVRLKHRLIYMEEDEALDAQTNIQHEKYSFADAADLERRDGKFVVTFFTDRRLKRSERQLLIEEELPDEVGLNEDVNDEEVEA